MNRLSALLPVLLAASLAIALVGCGVANPYEESSREDAGPPPADREAVEAPTPDSSPGAPPDEVVLTTPQGTLRYAASLAGNWEGGGAVRAFSRLATLSTGEARAEFSQLASEARLGVEQALGYSSSRATVEAVSLEGTGGFREAIVVTKQRIASEQIAHLPPEYVVTLATVTRWGKGWAISSWEPQR